MLLDINPALNMNGLGIVDQSFYKVGFIVLIFVGSPVWVRHASLDFWDFIFNLALVDAIVSVQDCIIVSGNHGSLLLLQNFLNGHPYSIVSS